MLTYGTQVNPALLRQDFSAIMQGAQARAQGTANAAQIRAQGMANLGQSISEGFKSYIQNREKNSILEGKNAGMLRAMEKDPVLNADPEFINLRKKQQNQGGLNLADNGKLNALLTTYSEQNRMKEEERRQQAYLKLQQDAAAANAERAAREKAEYERKNKFQTGMISALQNNPNALKDPDAAAQLAVSLGGNFEDLSSIQGLAMSRDNFERNKQLYQLDLVDRNLKIAEAVQRRDLDGKGDLLEVKKQDGVTVVIGKDRFGNPTTFQVLKDERDDKGQIAERYALQYALAESKGDGAGMARALVNIRSTVRNAELMSEADLVQNYVRPFVPNAGTAAPTEPLKVTGAPRPASATPAPTAEAARVTQPQTPTAAAPSATPPQLGRTFAPMAGAAPFEAPAPAQPAPAAAPASSPAQPQARPIPFSPDFGGGFGDAPAQPPVQPTPAPDLGRFFQEPAPEIILDEALLPKPRSLGRMFAPKEEDKNQPPVITETMLRMADRNRPIEPGQKNITASQLNRLREEEAAQAPSKLRQSALKLLEPKKGDSTDTLAIKQIIPYLPNRVLADKLLKQLSEKKEPKISSFDKDPFVRSMFAAAKEGRLPQLNMAAGRGF